MGEVRLDANKIGIIISIFHSVLDAKHSLAWNAEAIFPVVAANPNVTHAIAEGALMRLQCGARCFVRYRRLTRLYCAPSRRT
jgi:hypothetical protein